MNDAAVVASPAVTASRPRPLHRNLPFQALWAGSSASSLAVAVADVAYPLLILAVTGSPARAGLFSAVQAAGLLAGALPAGQLADRFSQRGIVALAEASRALVMAVVAAAVAMGWLTLPLLLGCAALLGIGQPVTGAGRLLLVRAVVPKEQLTRALTQDEVRINGAALLGPPIAGALFAVRALGHAAPFLVTSGLFAMSLLSVLLIRVRPRPSADRAGRARPDMLAGVRFLLGNPVLRAVMVLIMMVNTAGVGLELIAVVILRNQSVPPAAIGAALAAGAVGGLAGAPLVRPLHQIRPGVLLLAVCLLQVPVFALMAAVPGPWWMAGLLFASMLGVPAIRVLLDVLILRQAPEQERGRTVAAVMTLMGAGVPAGYAAAGVLLQAMPAQAAMLVMAGMLTLSVLYGATRRELRLARWPQ